MNRMDDFLKRTLAYYFFLCTKHEIIEGHKLERFTVYIDIDDGYLAYQIYYITEVGERIILDYKPKKRPFKVFHEAYLEIEAQKQKAHKSITFYQVIAEMEIEFLEYAFKKGYRQDIQFTIMYVPFFVDSSNPLVKLENPYGIPYELLVKARDTVLKN